MLACMYVDGGGHSDSEMIVNVADLRHSYQGFEMLFTEIRD